MSTTIDQRVVAMQFDNRHFEKNVSTTMSTLDKLKQKLHLPGAAKGLEDVSAAAKKVDLNPLGQAVETVRVKFSALQIMGVTALTNIANQAVNAGKRMASALTIDPVKMGFNEYETKINAIQTIKSNTESKGTTMDDIIRTIDELNTYADKTIYNFAEMTRNIGTFTAAGVGLEESAKAIQGIANLAAASGSNSQQASTAMYQLSQALSAGTVKLMDWNSVVNAGMGGELFQNALKDTARKHGIAVDSMIKKHGSFRESLTEGWITAEVLTETLSKMTRSGAAEYLSKLTGIEQDQITATQKAADSAKDKNEAYKDLAKQLAATGKITEEEATNILTMADNAENAATKVKTFTQLWDTLKESAQSGWGKTWELVFGNFEQAQDLFTSLSDFLGGFVNKMNDARNFLVEGAMDITKPWRVISEKFNKSPFGKIAEKAEKVGKSVNKVTEDLEYFQDVVSRVWRGEYGNSDTGRFEKLDAEGYNHDVIQDLVNKGSEYKLTMEDVEASYAKFGVTAKKTARDTKDASDKMKGSAKATKTAADAMRDLSDEELRNIGLTEDEIRLYRDLAEEADKAGISVQALIDEMSKKDGRTLLIESFKNAGQGLVAIFKALKDAWVEIFPPMSAVRLYGIIKSINEFSQHLRVSDETADKLRRTFKGVLAIVDILATIFGGAFRIAVKAVTQLLGMFDLNILDVTAAIGDALVKFRDWIDSCLDFTRIFKGIIPALKKGGRGIYDWIQSLKESEDLPRDILSGIGRGIAKVASFIGSIFGELASQVWRGLSKVLSAVGVDTSGITNVFSGAISSFREWIAALKESDNIPRDIILGLVKGLKNGATVIWNVAREFASSIVEAVKDFLGIHSPSRVFEGIGGYVTEGFANGIKKGVAKVWDAFKGILDKGLEFVKNMDWGNVAAIVLTGSLIAAFKKLVGAVAKIAAPMDALANLLNSTAGFMNSIKGVFDGLKQGIKDVTKGIKFEKVSNGIKNIAIAIAILVGALVVLAFIPTDKLWGAFKVIAALVGILAGIVLIVGIAQKIGGATFDMTKLSLSLMGIGLALLSLAGVVKIIGGMEPDAAKRGIYGVLGLLAGLTLFVGVFGNFVKGKTAQNFKQAGKAMRSLVVSLLLLTLVAKLIAGMSAEDMTKAAFGMAGLMLVVKALMTFSTIPNKNVVKVGSTLVKMAGALLLLVVVTKLIAGMSWGDMGKAAVGLAGLIGVIALLAAIGTMPSKTIDGLGSTLFKISMAMLVLAGTAKILATMSWGDMGKAAVGLTALSGIITILVYACKKAGPDAPKLALTLLAMSVAIGILAAIAVMIGIIDVEHMAKGIAAVGLLAGIISMMLVATKNSKDAAANITKMTIAVAVLVAAVALLTFIDGNKLMVASACLSVVLGMFALIIKAGSDIKSSWQSLLIMTASVAVIGGVLYLLSTLPIESSIMAATSLSVVMLAISGAMFLVSKMNAVTKDAIPSMLSVLAVVGVLAGILYLLGDLEVTSTLTSAIALSVLLVAMAGAISVLDKLGNVSDNAIIAMGALAIVVGILAVVLNTIKNLPVETTLPNALALSVLLIAMSGACAIMSVIPAGGAAAAGPALAKFIAIVGAVLVALGAISRIPGVKELVADGGEFLATIGHAIGNFVGSIIAGFGAGVSAGLVTIAGNLSAFMDAIQPFLTKVKMVDADMLAGVGLLTAIILAMDIAGLLSIVGMLVGGSLVLMAAELSLFMWALDPFLQGASKIKPEMLAGVSALADMILVLTAAGVLDGIASLFGGGSSITRLATQLPILGEGLKGFSDKLGVFSSDQLDKVNCAAQAVKTLAKASNEIPNTGGLLGMLVGENDLGTFAAQFPQLGTGLRSFLTNVGTFTDKECSTVTAAAEAVKTLASASAEIPNTGGWIAAIVGENDLSTFASQFPQLGTGLRLFLTNVGVFTEEEIPTVEAAANAVKILASAAGEIPNSGGWAGVICGNNDLGVFAEQFPKLGTGLRGLVDEVGVLTPEDEITISTAANAVKILAQAAEHIPNSGGWVGAICGDNDLGTFATDFPKVGEGIKGFADKLGEEWTNGKVATVNAGVNAVLAIAQLGDEDLDLPDGIEAFNKNAPSLGAGIKGFADSLSEIVFADIQSSIGKVNAVANMIRKMKDIESNWTQRLTDAIRNLPTKAIVEVVKEFKSDKTKTDLLGAIDTMVGYIIEGMTAKEDAMKKSGAALADAGKSGIVTEDKHKQWKAAGAYLTYGLAIGIKNADAVEKVKNAAVAVVKAAVKAAEDEAGIESPSRVFMGLGRYISEGFAIGIDNFSYLASDSSKSMASAAFNNTRDILSRLSDAISGDMDLQPTIRPVLDLSEVRARSKALDGMLNVRASSGVIANVRAIDARMEQRRQNGNNGEVVSAIKGLRKDLSKVGNTTYNVNGVTYDDGSNVSEAIKVLVRHARIERRK